MRIAFSTFGCKINQYDTEVMRHAAAGQGNEIVPFDAEADVYVINTCSVTGKSDYQCRQAIRAAVRRGKGARVIVAGCYAETQPDAVRAIPGVHEVIGNRGKPEFPRVLAEAVPAGTSASGPVGPPPHARTRSFLKIQDGCDGSCTYCIVPRARGRSRSEPWANVLARFDAAAGSGSPEIVLSGIHIGHYGRDLDPPVSLTRLVQELVKRPISPRIRISSIEPREVTSELVAMLGNGLCRHLHIPLQSGDDRVLKAMNRDYNSRFYRELIGQVAAAVPGIALGADIMVGFPGEGEKEFLNTLQIVEELPLTHLHVFSYSRRDGTPAAASRDQVREEVKKERSERLRAVGKMKNFEFRKRQAGRKYQVALEDVLENGSITGTTDNYIRVQVKGGSSIQKGTLFDVVIDDVKEDFTGGIKL